MAFNRTDRRDETEGGKNALIVSSQKKKGRFTCRAISLVSDAPMRSTRQDPLRLACRYIIEFAFVREYIDVMDFDGSSKLCVVAPCLPSRWFICRPWKTG